MYSSTQKHIFINITLVDNEVMAYKRRWRRSAITCIAGGNCERISVQWACKVAEFDLLIISLSMERILVASY